MLRYSDIERVDARQKVSQLKQLIGGPLTALARCAAHRINIILHADGSIIGGRSHTSGTKRGEKSKTHEMDGRVRDPYTVYAMFNAHVPSVNSSIAAISNVR